MNFEDLKNTLNWQHDLCTRILSLWEKEHEFLRANKEPDWADVSITRKKMLADLSKSLDKVRDLKVQWARLGTVQRESCPEIIELMHRNQNLIMKVIVLDRQNEELFLRNGLVPAGAMPSLNRQRPNYVAGLYRRNHSIASTRPCQ